MGVYVCGMCVSVGCVRGCGFGGGRGEGGGGGVACVRMELCLSVIASMYGREQVFRPNTRAWMDGCVSGNERQPCVHCLAPVSDRSYVIRRCVCVELLCVGAHVWETCVGKRGTGEGETKQHSPAVLAHGRAHLTCAGKRGQRKKRNFKHKLRTCSSLRCGISSRGLSSCSWTGTRHTVSGTAP